MFPEANYINSKNPVYKGLKSLFIPETLLELDSACCSYLENPALKIGNPLIKSEWPLLASKNAILNYRNLTLGHLTEV